MKKIILAEKSCFDAAVICCFSDLGLEAAREVVLIPVISHGEISVSLRRYNGGKIFCNYDTQKFHIKGRRKDKKHRYRLAQNGFCA